MQQVAYELYHPDFYYFPKTACLKLLKDAFLLYLYYILQTLD